MKSAPARQRIGILCNYGLVFVAGWSVVIYLFIITSIVNNRCSNHASNDWIVLFTER